MSKVGISELAIRDAHQSLHATRMTTADMLPACPMLDKIGYKFIEGWGGATYDSCIRFLNEDPWDRLRKLHSAMPNSKIMMLLRGQNLLGYRHYADDVVDKFVETAAKNGIDVFRIFDACNDPRNLERATKAAKKTGKHVQMAISYAVTPYHTVEKYAELAKTYAEFGADSICIKDMSGLLKPYDAFELVTAIKKAVDLPIEIHSHATTGLSVATELKAVEAGADILDTAISSMSMGTSHSPTETIVEMLKGSKYDTGLDTKALLEIAAYFREVRTHYASLESKFLGADTRILLSQVPGGMLSNLESQLKQQGAADKMDDVLKELPVVQKDVGYVPLVTPTSQIVGTQAVFNVLFGRYERMTGEFRDLLVGKYGKLPAEPNADLVKKALEQNKMENAVTCRPADLLEPEWDKMVKEAKENGGDGSDEDTLTYAMFPKVAPKFFKERANGPVDAKEAFGIKEAPKSSAGGNGGSYTVTVNGTAYNVTSGPAGDSMSVNVNGTAYNVTFGAVGSAPAAAPAASAAPAVTGGEDVNAPVAGTLLRYAVDNGASVSKGQTVIVLESMKMELEVKAPCNGTITFTAQTGSQVSNGQKLAVIGGTAAAPAAPAPVPAASAAPKAAPAAPAAASGGKPVNAPVAGTLLRYEVSEGASVSADTTIIVVESMKMELEIKAGSAGKVHFIAATGSQITSGQAIAEIQ
ncbi:MAG: sodium-extruding oxaloacetate decarboxylase subunit alpha [Treponema porcinum]|uniref:sodium-extruding oxaloacetate decarboxylase subunit alpha n=1 Tax=Treponema porcinum TaxID=261392 RepID=UPI0023528CFD|nr:sodium-extruding oxaloacetate decarboxylase subunit alpha [Treponema porcinum]MCI6982743.1 sodium-extruding oxaloacetate decarboxylase subunit alpha [Treponema porcinum]MCI7534924.1 sodium-extruding oxaloacetate decarboxylase subunit alpha [Treponema porcinum]